MRCAFVIAIDAWAASAVRTSTSDSSYAPGSRETTERTPIGPLSPVHWAAGLSPLSLASFVGALALGAPVRAFAYSFFGEALLDTGSETFRIAVVVLVVTIVLPLLVYRRLFGGRGGTDDFSQR